MGPNETVQALKDTLGARCPECALATERHRFHVRYGSGAVGVVAYGPTTDGVGRTLKLCLVAARAT